MLSHTKPFYDDDEDDDDDDDDSPPPDGDTDRPLSQDRGHIPGNLYIFGSYRFGVIILGR